MHMFSAQSCPRTSVAFEEGKKVRTLLKHMALEVHAEPRIMGAATQTFAMHVCADVRGTRAALA